MTERRLATVSFGAPESQVSTRSVPENSSCSRLAHPVKVVSIWEVRLDTFSGQEIRTSEEQLWKHSPGEVAAFVMSPSISSNAVQP